MISILLLSHIALALASLGFAGGVVIATRNGKLAATLRRVKNMWYGTLATIASGIFLAIATGASIGRSCGTLLSFLAVILAVHYYQRTVRYPESKK